MDYRDFLKKIQERTVHGVYLFQGAETYLAQKTLQALLDQYLAPGMRSLNFTRLQADETDVHRWVEMLYQMPFLGEYRVVVYDACLMGDVTQISKALEDEVVELAHVVAILNATPESVPKHYSMYKKLVAKNRIVDFPVQHIRSLSPWILRKVKEADATMSRDALEAFVEALYDESSKGIISLYVVENELRKLLAAGRRIDRDLVEAITCASTNANVFRLTESIGRRDLAGAIREYEVLRAKREEPVKILYMLSRFMLLLYGIAQAQAAGKSDATVERELSVSNYEIKKMKPCLRNYSLEQIERSLVALRRTDRTLKSKKNLPDAELLTVMSQIIQEEV